MGLIVRKRTKGKSSWLNFSLSKKGAHASFSQKVGGFTFNLSKRGTRTTYNFGNGVRWVSTKSKKKTKSSSNDVTKTYVGGNATYTNDVTPKETSKSYDYVFIILLIVIITAIQLIIR